MIVPLAMTIYFSTLHYSLLDPDTKSFVGLENYPLLSDRSRLSGVAAEHPGAGRFGACHHDPSRHPARAAARPARDRAQHCPADGDRAVFRDADRQRAGLEKPADASGLRTVCLGRDAAGRDADRLVHRRALARSDPDRCLAMAAVCDPDPAHGAAIPGRGAEGSGRDGRRRRRSRTSSTSRCRTSRDRSRW